MFLADKVWLSRANSGKQQPQHPDWEWGRCQSKYWYHIVLTDRLSSHKIVG